MSDIQIWFIFLQISPLFSGVPECSIKDGLPFDSDKSKILDNILCDDYHILENYQNASEGCIIDLSAITRSLASIALHECNTFIDFAGFVLGHIEGLAEKSIRIDIVADLYYIRILWDQVIIYICDTSLLSGFSTDFLQNEGNKTDLNNFIATEAQAKQWNKQVYITLGEVSLIALLGCVRNV